MAKEERIELRVAAQDAKRWRSLAAAANMSLSDWIRRRCNGEARDQVGMTDPLIAKLQALWSDPVGEPWCVRPAQPRRERRATRRPK